MRHRILKSVWYSPIMPGKSIFNIAEYCIGIVAIASGPDSDKWKCYIGLGSGKDIWQDEQEIAQQGQKVLKPVACAYFPELPFDKFTY